GQIEHRQVAQAAVDELGRPAAGPLREVTASDQSGREPAGGRLEDHTGPGDPAADHQHIERAAAEPGEVRGADHHAIPASRSAVPSSTVAPRTQSSLGVHSASLWLRPPALGTKIMPAGYRSATYLASWPAPAHRRWVEYSSPRAVSATASTTSGSNGVGGLRQNSVARMWTPSRCATVSQRAASRRTAASSTSPLRARRSVDSRTAPGTTLTVLGVTSPRPPAGGPRPTRGSRCGAARPRRSGPRDPERHRPVPA